jgi:hypothetical protein
VGQPDLRECGRCGAPLARLGVEGSGISGYGSDSDASGGPGTPDLDQ